MNKEEVLQEVDRIILSLPEERRPIYCAMRLSVELGMLEPDKGLQAVRILESKFQHD